MSESKPTPHNPDLIVLPMLGKAKLDLSDGNKVDELMARRSAIRERLSDNFNQVYSDPKANLTGVVKEFEPETRVRKTVEPDQPAWFRELNRQNKVSQARS